MDVQIPKLIMQTWKTKKLPDQWKPTKKSIKKFMPDWKYVLMTDKMNRDFVSFYFPDFLPYYDKFKYGIQRADAIRYCWLYIHGGLYIDCDYELLAPLDELFVNDETGTGLYLLKSANVKSKYTNSFMASRPRNPLWLKMIEAMKKPDNRVLSFERHLHVMNTTGPSALTRVIQQTGAVSNLLPAQKINPYTVCDKVFNKPGTLVRPLPGSSWTNNTCKAYHWIYCNYLSFKDFLKGLAAILIFSFISIAMGIKQYWYIFLGIIILICLIVFITSSRKKNRTKQF